MNKDPYRLVFSRAHDKLLAVEETAGASAKTSRGETIRTAPCGVFGAARGRRGTTLGAGTGRGRRGECTEGRAG
ncbi:ESPR-type extended signal peptide-containing protein [Burkholderia aenigmatica]|uniref:ESPR-type extended signal peptide-containing protein n=1 Tax=Burkholderia TaxID=32008 RepID=UPI0015842316